jgi:hypothetical protein
MRQFRGEHVYPVVTLSDTFMNTRYGGRQRPYFKIQRFITFGSELLPPPDSPTLAGPPSNPPALTGSAAAPIPETKPAAETKPPAETKPSKQGGMKTVDAQSGLKTVDPPTAKEVVKDEIPW